mgnify:FL=1
MERILLDKFDSLKSNGIISEYVITEIVDFQQDKNEIQNFFNIKANSILNIELDCGVKHNDKSVAKVLINNTELYYKPKNLNWENIYL